jgi:hypothetical protein
MSVSRELDNAFDRRRGWVLDVHDHKTVIPRSNKFGVAVDLDVADARAKNA